MLTFAIDYDGTWTTDPTMFAAICFVIRGAGHRVLLVTARATGKSEVEVKAGPFVDRVIFTPGTPKRVKCTLLGEAVDVWIDDKPQMVDRVR